ncbi:MAG: type II toxin-antitoxin system Phd/YefM family antitoxin [Deltaproteobacteria bacterium]|nr:type II toxin-antitoxin system Phd/YefM family antitoxin [Deltaproteobacteria bacterium]
MEDFQKILPVTKVKRNLLEIVKQMEQEEETIALTKNGEPIGVMMSLSRYEGLLETIEILGNKKIVAALKASQNDFKSGKVMDHESAWKE